jgi:hypothetical protein
MSTRGRLNGLKEVDAAGNFSQEEPRIMGDQSFDEWTRTMAGLDDSNPFGGQQSFRIPKLTSRWAYENWLERRNNADLRRTTRVPQVPGSRIPVSSDTLTYAMSLRSWDTGSEQFCDRRIMASQPSRIPVPTSAGQVQEFTSYDCIYTNYSAANAAPRGSRIPVRRAYFRQNH